MLQESVAVTRFYRPGYRRVTDAFPGRDASSLVLCQVPDLQRRNTRRAQGKAALAHTALTRTALTRTAPAQRAQERTTQGPLSFRPCAVALFGLALFGLALFAERCPGRAQFSRRPSGGAPFGPSAFTAGTSTRYAIPRFIAWITRSAKRSTSSTVV